VFLFIFYSENLVRHITKNHKFCPTCDSEKDLNKPLPTPPKGLNVKAKKAFVAEAEKEREQKRVALRMHKQLMQDQMDAFNRDKKIAL
jgi:hypothetical protein